MGERRDSNKDGKDSLVVKEEGNKKRIAEEFVRGRKKRK